MEEEVYDGHPVYSPEVIEFVKVSNAYCQYLESLSGTGASGFIRMSLQHLSSVYTASIGLEMPDPVYDDGNEKFVSEQDWSVIYQQIARILGPHNQYLSIVSEQDFDRSDLVTRYISEDMSDIYQELRDFTELYSRGLEDYMNDALWEVLENFEEHWGEKTVRAMSALHQLHINDIDLDESGDNDEQEDQTRNRFDNSLFDKFREHLGEED